MPIAHVIQTPRGPIELDRTRLMGILNVTPDSFFDGGQHASLEAAVAHGLRLVEAGADVLDVGGESTRPGSRPVTEAEEMERVVPVVRELALRVNVPISVDTVRASVAQAAIDAGAAMVNDVTALRADPEMVRVVARAKVPVVLMHALWPPETMQEDPEYVDVVEDVFAFLESRVDFAMKHGIPRERLLVDPGIGFGKTVAHNLALMRGIDRFMILGGAVLVGPSNKSFLGALLGKPVEARGWGTAAVVALLAGMGVHFLRVHDVAAMKDVVKLVDALIWQV